MQDDLAQQLQAAEMFHARGRFAEAEAAYEAVLAQAANATAALAGLAALALQTGRADRAAELLTRAVSIDPRRPDLRNNLGVALRRLDRRDEALAACDQALDLRPDYPEALNNRGNLLLDLRQPAEALRSFDAAVALRPESAAAHAGRAAALIRLERFEDAVAAYDTVLRLRPGDANALGGRGAALAHLGRFDTALASFDAALAATPDDPDAHNNRGEALRRMGRLDEALQSLDAALALRPDDPDARFHRAMTLLAQGRFAEGWDDYEHRWRAPAFQRISSGQVTADLRTRLAEGLVPGDVTGRRVLLVAEQGVGDVLMFASLLPDLMAQAASTALLCERRLHRLFAASFAELGLLDPALDGPLLGDYDLVLPIGSLARLYRRRREDFPGRPYLTASPAARERWGQALGPRTAPHRIGVSWKGGIAATGRRQRSMALADLRPILERPDCEAVSLQYGDLRAEMEAMDTFLPRPIRRFEPQAIADFDDLAALIQALDLVVSVQTAVVHLAGALGVPTLAMIPQVAEWRYGAAGPAMPWYGSVELFRRGDDDGWASVVAEVAARLGDRGA